MEKIALLDFDGTLVKEDVLDLLCELAGKGEESKELDRKFHNGEMLGMTSLVERINLLEGVSQSQIDEKLAQNSYFMKGVDELFEYLRKEKFLTVLASGNIEQVLNYYKQRLGIDYVVGSKPRMDGDVIMGITEEDYPTDKHFKVIGFEKIMKKIEGEVVVIAIGDSPGDKEMFGMADFKIAINPKGDIADFVNVVIKDDLALAIPLIERFLKEFSGDGGE